MEILPAIDLRGGKVVRLLQGDYARQIDYSDDPLAVAAGFHGQGARWLHLVDLDGAKAGQPMNLGVVRLIAGQGLLKIEFGGGVRSEETVRELLDLGVQRVVIGTRALAEWDWFAALVRKPEFAGRVMLGLDARDGKLAVRGWTEGTGLSVLHVARQSRDLPIAGLIYTDISTDGMLTGPNLPALAELKSATTQPIVASGGIRNVADIAALLTMGIHGAIVGRAVYEGALSVADAIAASTRTSSSR